MIVLFEISFPDFYEFGLDTIGPKFNIRDFWAGISKYVPLHCEGLSTDSLKDA